ncbi:MAG: metallopeptidase TldD-related protein [Candidatus Kapabacteria bacterium]|nr:metallopeptidase TldD-related protein [Candidatus Kapabacteria bacterium]
MKLSKIFSSGFAALVLSFILCPIVSSAAEEGAVLKYAKAELERDYNILKSEKTAPYYIAYSISDVKQISLSASFGKMKTDHSSNDRILDVTLRVGGYDFDNYHIIRGSRFNFGSSSGSTELPLDNNEKALKDAIWYATDKNYKDAIEKYGKAVSNKAVKVKEEDSSADFSHEKPSKYITDPINNIEVPEIWRSNLRDLSAMFSGNNWIYVGSVSLTAELKTRYFVNTEGSLQQWSQVEYRIMVSAKTKADDGMSLPLYKSYFSYTADGLPSKETIASDIKSMIELMDKLRSAPLVSTYTGPAILSGEAAGVFFHEIFGHRVEGHRQKDPNSSQTFKNYVGQKVLPEFIDVVFDPSSKKLDGREISGFYEFDDEGVQGQKVTAVENGVFKDFLMSRSPIENYSHSNGHGRKQAGHEVCSRQSNLIVEAKEKVSTDKLRDMLREECKKQNKEYGLYFVVVAGGFTFTGRTIPNAFNVNPLVVYKIYADGRPDELVRGVDLIGTPMTTFAKIVAADDKIGIFNGICGAESGSVPVSASSPSLLVSTIEVQKKQKSQAKPPILNAPED